MSTPNLATSASPPPSAALPDDAPPPAVELSARAAWLIVAATLLLVGAIRLRLLEVPFERDEGEYAYGAQLLLDGVPPFAELYTLKLPGTHLAYAAAFAAFGSSIAGARLGLLLANAATTLLLFALGTRRLGRLGGAGAAVAFALLSVGTTMLGLFGHATHFVALAASAGLLLFDVALARRRAAWQVAAGFAFGVGVLMKQPGAVFPAFALLVLLATRAAARDFRGALREGAALAAGTLAPLVAVAAWLAAAGVGNTARFWLVDYGAQYVGLVPLRLGLLQLAGQARGFLREAALFWLLAALGVAFALARRGGVPRRAELLALAAFAFVGVCPGLYFRGHYFLLALPAAALLVGAGLRGLAALAARTAGARVATVLALVVLALAAVQTLAAQAAVLFRLEPEQVARAIYFANPFPESLAIGRFLRERTSPDDRVAVLGSEPQIHFYAERRSATGFVYMYPLVERTALADRLRQQMIRELESAPPPYVVWVLNPTSWYVGLKSQPALFAWARRWLPARYRLVGEVVWERGDARFRIRESDSPVARDPSASILVWQRVDPLRGALGATDTLTVRRPLDSE